MAVSFLNTGRALECYAPVRLRGGRDASGNILLQWDRRSRINGTPFRGAEIPIGETTEQYQMIVYEDGTYAEAAITIIVAAPAAEVTAAAQAAAFGSPIPGAGSCYFGVAQFGQLGYGTEARSVI
jgi:hypothetical protein